ncbi:aminotransferase class V-fold PLP-dependent enzyme [Leptospira langatensis]|uniref:Aminotransferase class V-fold PLP-dependent enzyme n=1 Tax=Leptospira langatensis TaxID=2484983 RepID=A0A5F1ZPV7_9LEPT|nr:aminotransferase class V-fold PLP-dependent enzyme [Leptospira langatensis]TGK05606.1 aminotransferase class V-fold PLP-dependent enzyme [Leptospira langatensis]TGL38737.1 aminotransferase class V-fold PLP-dependent enzyme [Leptospira langatensis]
MKRIKYFDYNATHPPLPGLLTKVFSEYEEDFFNPSGPTRFSLARQGRIEEARKSLSSLTGCDPKGFVFVSSGTEANYSLAYFIKTIHPEIVYLSPFEHSSMYSAFESAKIPVQVLQTDKSGLISLTQLDSFLQEAPGPVCIIHAGNETGVLQPIEKISELCAKYKVPFFSDIIQSFGKIRVPFSLLDGFTFSGHKIGAGLGSSVLWFRPKFLKEGGLFQGGNQENGHRAGTENSPAILALSEAARIQFQEMDKKDLRLQKFQEKIENCLNSLGAKIVAESSPRLHSTTFALLPFDDLDFFMMGMEEKGFALSTGSSCKSRSREAAPSLLAMGYTKEEALRAIRISTGLFTTEEEVDDLILALTEVIRSIQ